MPPATFKEACDVLWPPGSSPANDVKHAAAVLLFNGIKLHQDLWGLARDITQMHRTSAEMLHPSSVAGVLTQEPCFVIKRHPHRTGKHIPYVRLDVPRMRAAAHSAVLARDVSPQAWQEDRSPINPTNLIPQPQYDPAGAGYPSTAAEPWVLGAGAGAGAGSLAPAPVQATSFRYFTELQLQDQSQQPTATLKLLQQGSGSYANSLAQHISTNIKQEPSTSPAGTRLSAPPEPHHPPAAAVDPNLVAEPYVLGAGTGSLALLKAMPPSDLTWQQHQDQGQQATTTYDLQLQQQGGGRYATSIAQHATHINQEASTRHASAPLSAHPQPHQHPAAAVHPNAAAEPCMLGTGTGSLAPAPLKATPNSDLTRWQHQDQGQHTTTIYEPQLQQQGNGNYSTSLAQNTTSHRSQEASTNPAGMHTAPQPQHGPAAAAPYMLSADAGGDTRSRGPAPSQAMPHSNPITMRQQHQSWGQHTTATYELLLQQQGDGSYAAILAEHTNANSDQWASTSPAGMLTGTHVQGIQGRSSSQNEINSLLELMPMDAGLQAALAFYTSPGCQPYLVDMVADSGRNIQLRLSNKSCVELPVALDLDAALQRLEHTCNRTTSATTTSSSNGRQAPFFSDTNRLGVPGSLHRISAMRDRAGYVYGLTYRVGRHVPGVADLLADVLSIMRATPRGMGSSSRAGSLVPSFAAQPSQSLLLLGRPGVGKTTLLRDVARLMSLPASRGGLGMSVVVVDTSNEIAGDNDQAHPCIGNARRMMVPQRHQQAAVMMEAVMNHTPEVIIVDEIASKEEAAACCTIAQRGVLLVTTAHGNSLGDLLRNPDLQGLLGGVRAVTLGDRLAADSNRGHKTRLERAGGVTFGSVVEILGTNRWRLHPDVARSVDALLDHSSSSSSSTTTTDLEAHAAAGVDTQLRSRVQSFCATTGSVGSKLLVSFESGKVPNTAVWAGPGAPPWTHAVPFHRPPAAQPQTWQQQQQQSRSSYSVGKRQKLQ